MEVVTIEEEFKRNPKLKQEDIDHLRKFIDQEKCAPPSIPDMQLFLFLHCCQYNIKKTKDLIKTNYEWRAAHLSYFIKRNPKLSLELERSLYAMSFLILPQRTSANELIMFVQVTDASPKDFHCVELVKLFFMFLDAYLAHHGSSNGLIIIADCKTVSFSLVRRLNITSLGVFIGFMQEAISVYVKGIHFVNSNMIFDVAFNMVKPFIYSSLHRKIHIHKSGSPSIFSHLAPSDVPKRFGGEEETSLERLHEQSIEFLRSFEPWFEEEEKALEQFALMRNQTNSEA